MSEDSHKSASELEGEDIPKPGTFLVLRIDPVASVAFLDDTEATEAATRLSFQDYVVYAPGSLKLFHPAAAFREEEIIFVLQGESRDLPEHFIEAGMIMPIAPQSPAVANLSSSREPLRASPNAFPWMGCHLSSFVNATVRCPNLLVPEKPSCALNKDEQYRYILYRNQDRRRRNDLRLEKEKTTPLAVEAQGSLQTPAVASSDEENTVDADEELPVPVRDSDYAELFMGLLQPEPAEDQITVTFSYDLSRIKELHDPRGFLHEAERISGIINASKVRSEAVKAAVAQQDAQYDKKTLKLLLGHRLGRFVERGRTLVRRLLYYALCYHPAFQIASSRSKAARRSGGPERQSTSTPIVASSCCCCPQMPVVVAHKPVMLCRASQSTLSPSSMLDQPSQETPPVERDYVPAGGTFSILRIDPVACVEHLEDPVATAACSNINGKDYLVYASGATKLFHPGAAYIEVNIVFVMQGLPQDIPGQFIDAAMSMPIAPQSSDTHPSGREAFELESGQVFPWSNCYLTTFASHVVRSPAVMVEERPLCKLNEDSLFRYQLADIEDVTRQQRLKFGPKSQTATQQATSEPGAVFTAQGAECAKEDRNPSSEPPPEMQETQEERDTAYQELFLGFIQPEAGEDLTVAKFTYDLSRVKELNDPRLFFVEVREISRIISASLARKESEKEEVARKDAARYNSKTGYRVSWLEPIYSFAVSFAYLQSRVMISLYYTALPNAIVLLSVHEDVGSGKCIGKQWAQVLFLRPQLRVTFLNAAVPTALFLRLSVSHGPTEEMASTGRCIPTFGTFATLRIDPVACVAHLEDPVATAACSKIASQGYLIYAVGTPKLFLSDAVFTEVNIIFVQRGQPRDFPDKFIDATMTVPIAPQSAAKEHPSGRPPLEMAAASPTFPWSDCYLSPFADHVVRTANVDVEENPVWLLDEEELMRFEGADMDDAIRQRTLEFEHKQAQASSSVAPAAVEPAPHSLEEDREDAESSIHAEPTAEEREEADKALLYSFIQPEASEELTAVTFTYDLARAGEFNDPKGFFDEVQEISRIITESLARKEAAKEDVAKEDAARYDSKTAKLLHSHRLTRAVGRVRSFITRMLCLSPPADDT
ncbi:hypothetical protein HMN09_00947200 [Mycena chlorophos]|uniref:Uncharacterized protein n=1 Tax=Mycena chlorophos TaxID=658473 RepID=A0A8H6SJ34_MYCCL|nr:hypothetical protein HMN09_00947200 [Mycena chlorophos]